MKKLRYTHFKPKTAKLRSKKLRKAVNWGPGIRKQHKIGFSKG